MQTALKPITVLPTHTQFVEFLLSILPPHPRDVATIYHEPRYFRYNPDFTFIRDVVLSITPTKGVYKKLEELANTKSSINADVHDHRQKLKPVCFLHRPFNLDRRAVPRGSLVTASHKRFDELLTVGWNIALAAQLDLDVTTASCIQGYKGDPERRIGLVARLNTTETVDSIHKTVLHEFKTGDIYPQSESPDQQEVENDEPWLLKQPVDVIAIMNAFGLDEVDRAVDTAIQNGWILQGQHARLLYLTGEPKELGLVTLKEKYQGMNAVCAGHRAAEEWGIKWLGTLIQRQWHSVNVHMIFEDEEPPPPKLASKPVTASGQLVAVDQQHAINPSLNGE